jgi:hypothetical protein
MEIKRYSSIGLFVSDMKKDLLNINLNNSADEFSLLSPQFTIHKFSSECKKINIDKWRKVN